MKADRNRAIHHMLVIQGKSLAVAAAAYGISRMRCQQIACAVAKTRTLTKARADAATKQIEPGLGHAPIPKRDHCVKESPMSYSLQVKAATKAEARAAIEAEFDAKVLPQFPNHERDRAAVLANADAALSLLGDDDTKDISLGVNGYIAWSGEPMTAPLTAIGISAGASHVTRGGPTAA